MEKRIGNVPAQKLIAQIEEAIANPSLKRRTFLLQGKAGTGKSTLTNDLIEKYSNQNDNDINPIVLGSTGIAALNLGGKTVHSFFGLGINDPDPMVEGSNSMKPEHRALVGNSPFIVIDEVSMLHANVIDTIDMMLRTAMVVFHNDGEYENMPFGGKVMLFVGDMFQLPPVVTDRRENKFGKQKLFDSYESAFFFDSHVFKNSHSENIADETISVIELQKNYRQGSSEFSSILDRIRENRQSYQDIAKLNSRVNQLISDDAIVLTTTNRNANNINSLKLARLVGEKLYSFDENRGGEFPGNMIPHDGPLNLKVGAQVMMINNDMENRWVNGSIGKVVEIDTENERIHVEIDGETHKVGRYRRENIDEIATPEYDDLGEPVMNKNGKHKMKVRLDTIGRYIQYPMKLAWAITIHKSQGQTFKNVKIDMGYGAFADAQTYVALSRCRTLDGISLVNPIRSKDIMVNERVLSYYLSSRKYIEI